MFKLNQHNTHCEHDDMSSDKNCLLKVPIFNHLAYDQLEHILPLLKSKKFKKKEIIYQVNEKADTLYIIKKGLVRMYRLSEGYKEQLLRFLYPGDFTGELNIFTTSVHESFAEAVEDTDVCMIKKDQFEAVIAKYPAIAFMLLKEMSLRLEVAEKQMTWISAETVEMRIAKFLVGLMDPNKDSNIVELTMSRKNLASFLGTSPETLSRRLARLEDLKYIKQLSTKVIQLNDIEKLLESA